MSETLSCVIAVEGERIHRYVAGTLEPESTAEFEAHLLGCVECQAAVREGAVVAAALRRVSAPVPETTWRRRRVWWTVPLAAAAVVLWLVVRGESPLARLGRVAHAPVFAAVPVRGDADSASRLADSGMTAYGLGRYREAARVLGTLPPSDRTPAVSFYRGLALLMSRDPRAAIRVLDEVPAASPYAAEAQFYLAKAWLRAGNGDSALAHLARISAGTRIAASAAALADSVREVLR